MTATTPETTTPETTAPAVGLWSAALAVRAALPARGLRRPSPLLAVAFLALAVPCLVGMTWFSGPAAGALGVWLLD